MVYDFVHMIGLVFGFMTLVSMWTELELVVSLQRLNEMVKQVRIIEGIPLER